MSSITIAALRIYPKASLSPSDRVVNCKENIYKEVEHPTRKTWCNIKKQDLPAIQCIKIHVMNLQHKNLAVVVYSKRSTGTPSHE
jgi:hypothetical protein